MSVNALNALKRKVVSSLRTYLLFEVQNKRQAIKMNEESIGHCFSLDLENIVKRTEHKFIILHRFSEINTGLDTLAYYITVNGDRLYDKSNNDRSIYTPELISTDACDSSDECIYKSTYTIKFSEMPFLLIQDNNLDVNININIKLKLILPFDYKNNILALYW